MSKNNKITNKFRTQKTVQYEEHEVTLEDRDERTYCIIIDGWYTIDIDKVTKKVRLISNGAIIPNEANEDCIGTLKSVDNLV